MSDLWAVLGLNQWPLPCQGSLAGGCPRLDVARCGVHLGFPGM